MIIKDLIKDLQQYDENLEVFMPIWKQQGIIIGMEETEMVYTNVDEDGTTITSVFIM